MLLYILIFKMRVERWLCLGGWRTVLGKASTALWSRARAGELLTEQGC